MESPTCKSFTGVCLKKDQIAKQYYFCYNNLMRPSTVLSIAALLLPIVSVPGAAAYDTPEKVLLEMQSTQLDSPFFRGRLYNTRYVKELDRAAEQQNVAAHPATTLKTPATMQASSASSAHTENQGLSSSATSSTPVVTIDAHTERILRRIQRHQGSFAGEEDVMEPTIHQGAPLSPTGMGTVVIVIGSMVAALWTLLRARRMEQR